jgi:prevent-host-death family protein
MTWRLADAKNRFSELFSRALSDGPQRVRRHNGAVVVIAEKDYEELVAKQAPLKLQKLKKILARVDAIPKDQSRSDDEILGYDQKGIPG